MVKIALRFNEISVDNWDKWGRKRKRHDRSGTTYYAEEMMTELLSNWELSNLSYLQGQLHLKKKKIEIQESWRCQE